MNPATVSHPPRQWHVLGTGSMACLWSAYLCAAGHDVCMIARPDGQREGYHGIRLETASAIRSYPVQVISTAHAASISRLLVCTKSYDVLPALQGVAAHLAADACVVLLQNGMGFQDQAAALVAPARLFCALSTEGANCPARFHVQHAGPGFTRIGHFPGGDIAATEQLRSELPHAQLDIRCVADILPEIWRKLAINCAINALTAIHGCRNGELLERLELYTEFLALCAEIRDILCALEQPQLGASLTADASAVARATAANRSSMLQDISAGRRTEIDSINGYLCRRAHEAKVPCPLNQTLCQHILEREHSAT